MFYVALSKIGYIYIIYTVGNNIPNNVRGKNPNTCVRTLSNSNKIVGKYVGNKRRKIEKV